MTTPNLFKPYQRFSRLQDLEAQKELDRLGNHVNTLLLGLSPATGGPVVSFNGRGGAITPLAADYDSFFLTPTEGAAAYDAIGAAASAQAAAIAAAAADATSKAATAQAAAIAAAAAYTDSKTPGFSGIFLMMGA